jgi:hypothetical protein
MEERKKLYVDGLNFSTNFGFVKKAWNIEAPTREIEHFVKACRAANWEPTIFIDAGIESIEAMEKWLTRREKEVLEAVRDVPQALSCLMGDIFRKFDVVVHYSPWNVDNDDCLAFFAQRDGAAVLSNDIDFARYRGKTYEQFGAFNIVEDKIVLKPKKIDERKLPQPRNLPTFPPKMIKNYPGFVYLKEKGTYYRGSPSFATKFYGNLHGYVTNLRHILYNRLGLDHVDEKWPEYIEPIVPEVVWVETEYNKHNKVAECPTIDSYYVKTRDKIFNSIHLEMGAELPNFTNNEKWNFEMAIMLVIAEIYAVISGCSTLEEFSYLYENVADVKIWLKLYEPDFENDVPSVCRNWKSDGTCRFGDNCVAKSGHFICTCWKKEKCRYRHEL